jgi:hypothetical protein
MIEKTNLTILPKQEFKLQIINSMGICRDELFGVGQEQYTRLLIFAHRIAECYKGSKVKLLIKSKATLQPVKK